MELEQERRVSPEILEEIAKARKVARESGQDLAFGFARKSSLGQDVITLEQQKDAIVNYSAQNNLHLAYVWEVTETAWNEKKRVEFQEMLTLTVQCDIRNLVFKDPDRAFRNHKDYGRLEELCKENLVRRHYYDSGRVIGPESHYSEVFMEGVLSVANKYSSDQTSHKVRRAKMELVKKGVYPSYSPYGYFYDREKRRHFIDPELEPTVRLIFHEFDSGKYSITEFVEFLNDKGYRSKTGRVWTRGGIHKILINPFYAGWFFWHGELYEGNHETYHTKAMWETRMGRLGERRNGTKTKKHIYPFTKFFACGHCGSILTGEYQKGRHKKGDYTYYKHPCGYVHGKLVYYRQDQITDRIDKEIKKIRYSPEFARQIKFYFEPVFKTNEKAQAHRDRFLAKKKEDLKAEKRQLGREWLRMRERFDEEDLERMLAEIDAGIEAIENEEKQFRVTDTDLTKVICKYIDKLHELPEAYLKSGDIERKAELIKLLADKIEVTEETVKIHWSEPYSFFLDGENPLLPGEEGTEPDPDFSGRGSNLSLSTGSGGRTYNPCCR